jgi:hypothetical protein
MKATIYLALLLVSCCTIAEAASVHVKNGNIFYVSDGKEKQITSSGRDEDPVINPKGDWVYFVRSFEGKFIGEKYYPPKGVKNTEGILKQELWMVKTDGQAAKMLFRSEHAAIDGPDPDYVIATVGNIQFSPSGDKVYFETPEWVTSAGLHMMNVDGSQEQMLGPGNDTKIVLSARTFDDREKSYEGYIVTAQHRYYFYGGSYDWYYLFTPDLKGEVAPLGDDPKYFTEMGDIKYTDGSEKDILKKK